MRTTVTLDSDTEQIVRRRMAQRRVSFKQALNDLVREGRTSVDSTEGFRTTTFSMGLAAADLDKALLIAGELEDDALVRKMESGS